MPVMIHWIPTDLGTDDIAKRYRAIEMIEVIERQNLMVTLTVEEGELEK